MRHKFTYRLTRDDFLAYDGQVIERREFRSYSG